MLVVVESPYAGFLERNVLYARSAVRHSLSLGEAPFASHLLYTQHGVLRDNNAKERRLGIVAGLRWSLAADLTAFYVDFGWSPGMIYARDWLTQRDKKWEERTIPEAAEKIRRLLSRRGRRKYEA